MDDLRPAEPERLVARSLARGVLKKPGKQGPGAAPTFWLPQLLPTRVRMPGDYFQTLESRLRNLSDSKLSVPRLSGLRNCPAHSVYSAGYIPTRINADSHNTSISTISRISQYQELCSLLILYCRIRAREQGTGKTCSTVSDRRRQWARAQLSCRFLHLGSY